MKNVMKVIICIGFFCAANFGMQKEGSLYIECGNSSCISYRGIGKDGCDYDIDDATLNILKVSNRFKSGDLMQSKDWKYCVQARSDYASHIAVRRGTGANDAPLNLNSSDFLVPLELTEEQLKRVVKLRDEKRTVFVTGQYNSRLDIESISCDIRGLREQLRVELAKKQELERLERQRVKDKRDDVICSERCCSVCACISLPVIIFFVLAGRASRGD